MEMDRYYRAGSRVLVASALAGIAANYNGDVVLLGPVPQGKVWLIENVIVSTNTFGVAAGVIFNLNVRAPDVSSAYTALGNIRYLTGELGMLNLPGPMIWLPGYTLAAFTTAAAAPTAFNYFARAMGIEVSA